MRFVKLKLISLLLVICVSNVTKADDYNRLSVAGENLMPLYSTEWFYGLTMSGPGIDYVHGFSISDRRYIEVGAGVNYLSGENSEWIYDDTTVDCISQNYRNLNLRLPISYVFDIRISDKVSIPIALGMNMRINLLLQTKYTGNIQGVDIGPRNGWTNVIGHGDPQPGNVITWPRCHFGLHYSFGLRISRVYIGMMQSYELTPLFRYYGKENDCEKGMTFNYTIGYYF